MRVEPMFCTVISLMQSFSLLFFFFWRTVICTFYISLSMLGIKGLPSTRPPYSATPWRVAHWDKLAKNVWVYSSKIPVDGVRKLVLKIVHFMSSSFWKCQEMESFQIFPQWLLSSFPRLELSLLKWAYMHSLFLSFCFWRSTDFVTLPNGTMASEWN